MFADAAPQPTDLLWDSLKIGFWNHILRTVLVTIFLILLVLFWAIPVFFISSIANLATITNIEGFSWLEPILNINSIGTGFIEGFFPSLVLIIFMALLVPIIKVM